MTEVLSQSEIDTLLSAITSGEVDAEELRDAEESTRIRTYDFRRAMRFSKDHIRIISRIHEHFARLMTTHLSGQLRSMLQFQVESVDQVPYEEFIHSIPALTVIQVMEFSPLEGKVVVEIHPQIVFAMLDRLMGGAIKVPYRERELTEIEVALLDRLFGSMVGFLRDAWKGVSEIQPRMISMESNPQFLQIATPNETVLVISCSARVGEATGLLNICIPHVTIEPLLPKLTTQYFMDGGKPDRTTRADQERMTGHLRQVGVEVAVELGRTALTVQECVELQVGDVIAFSTRIDEPVTVLVDGVPTYLASVGKNRGHYAVRVLQDWKEVAVDDAKREQVVAGRN